MKTLQHTFKLLLVLTILMVLGLNIYNIQNNMHKKTEAATSVTHNINP
jgi:hypothetical protein